MQASSRIRSWLRERFPRQPHVYFGLSGATLLSEALENQPQSSVVLSAFICPSISLAVARAGKRLLHIDADPTNLHPRMDQLEKCLAGLDASDTAVLIDHPFGYPFPGLDRLRRKFPRVLFIEDCARALGVRLGAEFPGTTSEWVLLSMYKTIAGSLDGAILLTNNPLPLRDRSRGIPSLREQTSTIAPLRFIYDLLKRSRPDFDLRRTDRDCPAWSPTYGLPNRLCLERFEAELTHFESRAAQRRLIASELMSRLSGIDGIERIEVAPGCEAAGHFVSFRARSHDARNRILTRLHKQGFFLSRTWDLLPHHYLGFSGTFPWGHPGSQDLAEHIAHIPVDLFRAHKHRQRFLAELQHLSSEFAAAGV